MHGHGGRVRGGPVGGPRRGLHVTVKLSVQKLWRALWQVTLATIATLVTLATIATLVTLATIATADLNVITIVTSLAIVSMDFLTIVTMVLQEPPSGRLAARWGCW